MDLDHDWDGDTEGVSTCRNCGVILSQIGSYQECPEAEDEDPLEVEDELEDPDSDGDIDVEGEDDSD